MSLLDVIRERLEQARAQRFTMPLEHALTMASPSSEFRRWLEWRRDVGDPGPVHFDFGSKTSITAKGQVWTELSEREEREMSHMLVEEPNAAVELGEAMNRALRVFIAENEGLVRQACQVPDTLKNLTHVVVCAFLGHTLEQVRLSSNRNHVEHLVLTVLDRLEAADATKRTADEASH